MVMAKKARHNLFRKMASLCENMILGLIATLNSLEMK